MGFDSIKARDHNDTPPWSDQQGINAGFALPLRWRLERPIGVGGQAVVWLARDTELDEWVAVKVFPADLTHVQRERLRREVKLGRQLSHPNLVKVFELIEGGDRFAVAMEWIPAGSLHHKIENGPIPIDQIIAFSKETLDALTYLHEKNIIHRDVKPSNLLIDVEGHVRLADLGMVRPLDPGSDLTRTAITVGTPGYMSPEQLRGEEVGPASDLYSLGATLFELLTGKQPFRGKSEADAVDQQLNRSAPDPRALRGDCPNWLARFVLRMLEKAPKDRFRDASAALAALERRRVVILPRRWRRYALIVGILGVLAIIGVALERLGRRLPTSVQANGDTVVVADSQGRELWRKDFPGFDTQAITASLVGAEPSVVIGTIPASGEGRPGSTPDITVFDALGQEQAQFASVGIAFRNAYPDFADRIRLGRLYAMDLSGDDRPELVWTSWHTPWYPSLIGIWDGRAGTQAGPLFVNSGLLRSVSTMDLDGDGVNELIVTGVNNPLGFQGIVVVIKAIRGPSKSYLTNCSPDLLDLWDVFVVGSHESLVSYTPLGTWEDEIKVVKGDRQGLTLEDGQRRIRLDGLGNPEGSPFFNQGSTARMGFWNELARSCREIEAGIVAGDEGVHRFVTSQNKMLSEPPMRLAADLMLARSLAGAGQHGRAVAFLRAQLDSNPENRDLRLRLAEQLVMSGDKKAGMIEFISGCNAQRGGRGLIDTVIGGTETAALLQDETSFVNLISRFQKLFSIPNKHTEAMRAVYEFCGGNWYARSLVVTAENDVVPWVGAIRKWAAMERGEDPAAVFAFGSGQDENPEVRDVARLLAAAALLRQSKASEAQRLAEGVLADVERKGRTDFSAFFFVPLAHRVLADAMAAQGERDKANPHYRRAAEIAPACWFGKTPRQ